MKSESPRVLVALPMAFQDGHEKHNGIMRYLKRANLGWHIQLDRLSPSIFRPTIGERTHFDGAILDGCCSTALLRAYAATKMPLVAIDWRHPEIGARRQRFVLINADNAAIGRQAADTLFDVSNFASFACLPLPHNSSWSFERQKAFVRRLGVRHIDVRILDPLTPLGPQLRALPKPTAVFAVNDDIGALALQACAQENLTAPDDLSILGVDNEEFTCRHTIPPLASIQPDFEQAGFLAAKALHGLLERHSTHNRLTYSIRGLASRESMGPARSAGRLVARAMELIKDPKTHVTDIESLARQLGVSRRLLDLRFREIRSQTMLEAITDIRMERACSLLRSTNLSISEICAASGLGSGTYPMRAFRRRFGMTMGDYRKSSPPLRQSGTVPLLQLGPVP